MENFLKKFFNDRIFQLFYYYTLFRRQITGFHWIDLDQLS